MPISRTAEPGVATSPVSVNWLFEMVTSESVAPQFSMSTPFASVCVHWLFVNVKVPLTLAAFRSSNETQLSSLPSPAPLILPFVKLKADDARAVDAVPGCVLEVHVVERRAARVGQRDAVAGRGLDRAARVVAALRRVTQAGNGEAAARARGVEDDAVRRAVGGDAAEGEAAGADGRVRRRSAPCRWSWRACWPRR